MAYRMIAEHAMRPASEDAIFGAAAKATAAEKIYGKNGIINSTIGTLLEDDGSLVAFKTVYGHLKNLDDTKIAAYAGLSGIPEYLETVKKACFGDHEPKGYIKAVATPGGTGAVRHAIYNYTSLGDSVLTSDWYWDPYKTICEEHGRKLENYRLFNEKGTLDMDSLKQKCDEILSRQDRLVLIINTPAHNPTGYTVSDDEWDQILGYARNKTVGGKKKIVILCDIAYIDFAGDGARDFFDKFTDLPEDLLILVAYSASKSYTMYGLRNGAIICIAPNEETAAEFFNTCSFSNRANWSNGTRGAMQVVADIYTDSELYETVEKERDIYRALLKSRGDAFLGACRETGLKTTTYRGGFFVSVPYRDPQLLADALAKKLLFTVPLQGGIRLALCAVSEDACRKMPALIKETIEELDKQEQ